MTSRVERDHIYYHEKHSPHSDGIECLAMLDLGSCAVYHGEKEAEWIMSTGYHYLDRDGVNCIWLLPPVEFECVCSLPYVIW